MSLKTLNWLKEKGEYQCQPVVSGQLTRMVGLAMEAVGCKVKVGDRCWVEQGREQIEAEVVGFDRDKCFLMPIEPVQGLSTGARVTPILDGDQIPAGDGLLGRVLNGAGTPLDGLGEIVSDQHLTLEGKIINPMQRAPIREIMDVGIRAINALLTVGRGQRMGLFAGSGVGKSMLLGMMTRFTTADVVVVGLVGERGREVQEFIQDILGEEGLKRAVVIASPADDSPIMRMRAASLSTAIAESFRDEGKDVLLLMDSLTRYGQAQREIALAVGEPPATKGYPPSVFAKIPKLVERTGNGPVGGGSITAFYTVLTEGDDLQDPIADSARAILDGHVVLSRRIAEEGQYPAIDIEASISRAMPQIVAPNTLKDAQRFKYLYSLYQQNKDLLSVGAYNPGSNPELDMAVRLNPVMKAYLAQDLDQSISLQESLDGLNMILNEALGRKPEVAQ
ncbi:flagellar protein export ATPase FliI [Oceaniserpentilla sp. 4NH20-0058]|uniref:flagellar protein export ATPase FliI n=1 Tax=Oceaniserpentilla sp. 4NH20-0058 TaxID=3127660 RepID=UPI003106BB67